MNVNEDLQAWARGMYTTEAAAELLILVFNGRFADSQNPWIQLDDDHRDPGHWVDFASIPEHLAGFSSGEQRILRIVASIGSTEVDINLSDDLSGLDRSALRGPGRDRARRRQPRTLRHDHRPRQRHLCARQAALAVRVGRPRHEQRTIIDKMSDAEPVVGVFALRTFRVSVNGYLVPATQYSNEWATGTAIAQCGKDHRAPDDNCTCGLYSMNNVHQLTTQYRQARRLLAVIALEGQTIQGPKGWRSQAARVIDVWTGPRAVPDAQLEQLRRHLPEVRFHTDVHDMLTQYPELVPDPRPRRTVLAVGAHGTWDRIRAYQPSPGRAVLWTDLTAALVAVLALNSTPRIPAGFWVDLATTVLTGLALAAVVCELPGQLIVLAIRGGIMPLVVAPWRPVKYLWWAGSSVLTAGIITNLVLHEPIGITGPALAVACWVLLLLSETFLCAMHRTTRPTTLPVLIGWRPIGSAAVRTGWEPARSGRRRWLALLDPKPFQGKAIASIIITTTQGH